jgi:hypothetical protein
MRLLDIKYSTGNSMRTNTREKCDSYYVITYCCHNNSITIGLNQKQSQHINTFSYTV